MYNLKKMKKKVRKNFIYVEWLIFWKIIMEMNHFLLFVKWVKIMIGIVMIMKIFIPLLSKKLKKMEFLWF